MDKKKNFDKIFNKTFRYSKKLTKEFYFKIWRKNPPKCPAFGGERINVSRELWDHVLYAKKRPKTEILGRFFVFERAKCLLEIVVKYSAYRKKGKEQFWLLTGKVKGVRVKVVIRSINKGEKHLYSIIRKGNLEKELEG